MKSFAAAVIIFGFLQAQAFALAKKQQAEPPFPDGKRVVKLEPIQNVQISLPDGSQTDFGASYRCVLSQRLVNSGRYIVITDASPPCSGVESAPVQSPQAGFCPNWNSSVTPAADFRANVTALNFRTGNRGERMFYGFDERLRNQFNDGTPTQFPNEFPLRDQTIDPNFFDRTFDDRGLFPIDSRAGLDIGDAVGVDLVLYSLDLEYARYESNVHLEITVNAPNSGVSRTQPVEVSGQGSLFDVAPGYHGIKIDLQIKQTGEMRNALNNALSATTDLVDQQIGPLPMIAKVDQVLGTGADTQVLLGTGPDSKVAAGTRYAKIGDPSIVLEVTQSCAPGSVAKIISGSPAAGETYQEIQKQVASPKSSEVQKIVLTDNPPPTNPQQSLLQQLVSFLETSVLPYRVYRYFEYDQDYKPKASAMKVEDREARELGTFSYESSGWQKILQTSAWAKQIGLDQAIDPKAGSTIVAVIDSGVDYNHPAIHDAIWINPKPVKDSAGDQDLYGWDFISGDPRPYDDTYHGTEIASAVLGVAPEAKIMALKVFNPYGITNSAAVFGAMTYAVDHGAKVIVCAWAGRPAVSPKSLEMGIQYAKSHGVLVVTSAGDRGNDLATEAVYPAAFSKTYDNVIAVSGVDSTDALVSDTGNASSFGKDFIAIAAPGKNIDLAEPRNRRSQQTSAAYAAALVAGAFARNYDLNSSLASYTEAVTLLESQADVITGLQNSVQGGRRLHVR